MRVTCPECGFVDDSLAAECRACGAALVPAPALGDVPDLERSSAYQQFVEIRSAVLVGVLASEEALPLWGELEGYLEGEVAKFASFPTFDFEWPAWEQGLAEVRAGLVALLEAVRESRSDPGSEEASELAARGNERLRAGATLLVQARSEAAGDA